jgi:DNA invertase Pin-like site-specific DNA recombinase
MMRAALLARVSKADQADPENKSLDAQLRLMRERCAREGWEIAREFVAPGESAYTARIEKRRVLREVLAAAEANGFDVLIVHESSRLARNALLDRQVRDRLDACHVELLDLTSPVSRKTASGKLLVGVQAQFNEYLSDLIGEHAKKSYRERFELGLHCGHLPVGYMYGETSNDPGIVIPHEAAILRQGFEDYAAGKGFTELMHEWNAAELRPRSLRGYTKFNISGVQRVLGNDFYAGFVRHLGERKLGVHQPIITEDLWQRGQTRVQRRSKTSRGGGGLLTGMLVCRPCNGPIWTTSVGSGRFRYYREAAPSQNRECPDSGAIWRCDDLDEQLDAVMRSLAVDDGWLKHVGREARRSTPRADCEQRESLADEKKRITNAYLAGALTEGEWRRRLADVDRRLASLPTDPRPLGVANGRLSAFAELWDRAPIEVRRESCRILFESVIVDMREYSAKLRPHEEFLPLFQLRREFVAVELRRGSGPCDANPLVESPRTLGGGPVSAKGRVSQGETRHGSSHA